jgi:hypothetical protein
MHRIKLRSSRNKMNSVKMGGIEMGGLKMSGLKMGGIEMNGHSVSYYIMSAILVLVGLLTWPYAASAEGASLPIKPLAQLASAASDSNAKASRSSSNPDTVRPEMAKPLQLIQELLKAGKGQDALQKLKELDVFANRTAYENYIIDHLRGSAASLSGDADTAAKSFEAVIASGRIPAAQKMKIIEAIAANFYRAKNYSKTAEWCARYFKEGGLESSMRSLWIQSMYMAGDLDGAAREMIVDIELLEKANKTPPEDRLQLLASIYQRKKDAIGYASTVEKLLSFYPKKDYWAEAIYRVSTRQGFPDRLVMDVARLKMATANLVSANEYFEYAQIALTAGFSLEAQRFLEKGFTDKVLGHGDEADRHRRLRSMIAKSVEEDRKGLNALKQEASAGKDGNAMLNVGYSLVLAGDSADGIRLMEKGLTIKGIKRPDDAKLLYGAALLIAGQKDKARTVFSEIRGDGTGELAKLWMVHAAANR